MKKFKVVYVYPDYDGTFDLEVKIQTDAELIKILETEIETQLLAVKNYEEEIPQFELEYEQLSNSNYIKGDGTLSKIRRCLRGISENKRDINQIITYIIPALQEPLDFLKNWPDDNFDDYQPINRTIGTLLIRIK
jgi:hypothetical protein